MINQGCSSYYPAHYESQIEEEDNPIYEKSTNIDILLGIIKKNENIRHGCNKRDVLLKRTSSLSNINRIYHKNWKSKINFDFRSMIDDSLLSFANKLNDINTGSWEQKMEFLSAISGVKANYPFMIINELVINFIDIKVSKIVFIYIEKEKKKTANNANKNYGELKEIITRKVKENILKEGNKLELVNDISSKISELHKKQHQHTEERIPLNVKTAPFIAFMNLYRNHLTESYGSILSKSIEMFEDLGYDEECCMSFVFDTLFDRKVIKTNARDIKYIIHKNVHSSILSLENLSYKIDFFNKNHETGFNLDCSGPVECSDDFKKFIMQSKKKLEISMKEFFAENDILVIENNIVDVCNKSLMSEMLYYAKKYLEEKLVLYGQNEERLRSDNVQ